MLLYLRVATCWTVLLINHFPIVGGWSPPLADSRYSFPGPALFPNKRKLVNEFRDLAACGYVDDCGGQTRRGAVEAVHVNVSLDRGGRRIRDSKTALDRPRLSIYTRRFRVHLKTGSDRRRKHAGLAYCNSIPLQLKQH